MQILIKPTDKACDHNLTFSNKIEKSWKQPTVLTRELTSITGAVPEVLAEAFLYLSIVDLTLIQLC